MSSVDAGMRVKMGIVVRSLLRVIGLWVLLLGGYFLMPDVLLQGRNIVVVIVLIVLLFAAVVAIMSRSVLKAKLPRLRAAESAGFAIPFYLVLFALVYLAMSSAEPQNFTEPLGHSDALYYTVTMFATVGFGDITPVSELARNVATFQMLLNLVVLSVVVKVIFAAGRLGAERKVHG